MDNFLKTGSEFLNAHPDFKLVGRDEDLRRLSSILMRSKAASVLLVGAGGVGLTSLCLGLQASKNDDNAPFDIVSKRLFWLDTDGLFASGKIDEMNKVFQNILVILKRTPDSVLVIEDTRDFIEGARNNGCSHFINSLNSAVKNGDTQVILESKDNDLEFILKAHSDMRECYTMMELNEPTGEALQEIAKNCASSLEKRHGIRIALDAVSTAIDLTNKYRTQDLSLSRAQPERLVNLLDRALASYRLDAHKRHPDIIALEKIPGNEEKIAALDKEYSETQDKMKRLFRASREAEINMVDLETEIARKQSDEEDRRNKAKENGEINQPTTINIIARMSGNESPEIKELKDRLKAFEIESQKNNNDFQELARTINDKLLLTKELVMEEFSRISGIPVSKMGEDEREKLRNLDKDLKSRVVGQDRVIDQVSDGVKLAKVQKRRPGDGKPSGAWMFYGPSGVGKTELAKALAHFMYDDTEALLRIDMSEYMEKHAVAKLIGAPPGYELAEVGGFLTNEIRKNGYRIVLFDEIEKAHPDVFNILLQVLSDGRLTDNIGRTVDFSNTFIIMTTNLGQSALLDKNISNEDAKSLALKEIETTYRPELLNRLAGRRNIIGFDRLEIPSIEWIIMREINDINYGFSDTGISLEISNESLNAFCIDNYDPKEGARGLPGYIQTRLAPIISNLTLEDESLTGVVNVEYNVDTHQFKTLFTQK